MSEHTPGPWKFESRPVFGEFYVRQDPKDWNERGYQLICSLPATKPNDMFRANARLIAAAPELLDALRLVHDKVLTEYHSRDSYVRQQVEAAIAKATAD